MPDTTTAVASTVTVRVVYLARLREAFARADERLELPAHEATAGAVVAALRTRGGIWADELAAGRAVRIAVNHVLAAAETPLAADDEVALLPPVTGG